MRRRTFLKVGGCGAVALSLSGLAYRVGSNWWDQTPSRRLEVLSVEEADIVAAIADTMFPGEPFKGGMPSATQTGIVEFYDQYLASIDVGTQKLLRLLLHAIDDGAVLANLSGTRFRFRSQAEREEILISWDNSWFSARRAAWTSLKIFIAMGYTEHPAVLEVCGIEYVCATEPTMHTGPPNAALGAI